MNTSITTTDWWLKEAERLLTKGPDWVPLAVAGTVIAMVLVAVYSANSRLSKSLAERDKKHQEAVDLARQNEQPLPPEPLHLDPRPLIGGLAVSLNGLWHFAQDQVHLSFFFALGFVSMFDVLEMHLFSQLYKMADASQTRKWTFQLKVMRGTVWAFVFASAAANAVHAPNMWAAPALAIMPIGAAWVIYMPIKNALAGTEAEEDTKPEGRKPGPLRLAALVWSRLWAWMFGLFGLDVTDRADEMVSRARAREAADASYELRKALTQKEELEAAVQTLETTAREQSGGQGGRKKVSDAKLSEAKRKLAALNKDLEKKIRPKAQGALELAETHVAAQGLQLMQRMAWLTRADEVALLDYGPDSPAMKVLEELNIAANASFVESNKRARDADRQAQEAQELKRQAEEAAEEAKKKLEAVEAALEQVRGETEKVREQAEKERELEEQRLQSLVEKRALLEGSDATAGQLYQKTVKELDDTRSQLTALLEERGKLMDTTDGVRKEATEAREEAVRLEGVRESLEARLNGLLEERGEFVDTTSTVRKEAIGYREEVIRLEGVRESLEARLNGMVEERNRLREAADRASSEAQEARDKSLQLEARLDAIERMQKAGVPARAQKPGRVDAHIGSGGGDTRQRVRDLLAQMSPEERQQSQRKIAAQLMDQVGLGLDAVRNHLRAIEQEDAEASGIPSPREHDDPDDSFEDDEK